MSVHVEFDTSMKLLTLPYEGHESLVLALRDLLYTLKDAKDA
jgi:hypothetical protein